jgi:carboxylesterase type B
VLKELGANVCAERKKLQKLNAAQKLRQARSECQSRTSVICTVPLLVNKTVDKVLLEPLAHQRRARVQLCVRIGSQEDRRVCGVQGESVGDNFIG